MTFMSITTYTFRLILLPFVTTFNLLARVLVPFFHIFNVIGNTLTIPLTILAKFETLYIYLGTALLLGLLTGTLLHITSSLLTTLLHLRPTPSERLLAAHASSKPPLRDVKSRREQRRIDAALQTEAEDLQRDYQERSAEAKRRMGEALSSSREYAEYFARDLGTRRDGREGLGLSRQTIIEEEDDSDDF